MITARELIQKGQLTARPGDFIHSDQSKSGLHWLQLDQLRDGLLYVPKNYEEDRPASLAVMLHGAGGDSMHGLELLKQYADTHSIILIAPASRLASWDIIARNSFGPDVIFIDQVLSMAFKSYNIDSRHIAIGGFSDGASYALCIGLSNGDLFTHIIAFSPGFYGTIENKGKPRVFISHGVDDHILPIGPCSRRIVPRLQRLGYDIDYREFKGEHQIPADITASAVDWFLTR